MNEDDIGFLCLGWIDVDGKMIVRLDIFCSVVLEQVVMVLVVVVGKLKLEYVWGIIEWVVYGDFVMV